MKAVGHFDTAVGRRQASIDQGTAANYLLFLSAISVALFFFNDVTEQAPRNDGVRVVELVHNVFQTLINASCGSAIVILCCEMYLVVFYFEGFERRRGCGEAFILFAAFVCFVDLYFYSFSYFIEDTTDPAAHSWFLAEFIPLICVNAAMLVAIFSVALTYRVVRLR